PAPVRPEVVHREVVRDPEQPRRERRRLPAELADRLQHLQERLRRQVLGVVPVPDRHVQVAVDAVEVQEVQLLERLAVAVLGTCALGVATGALMIWPPSKATSTRTESASVKRDHLREDAVDGVWMDECNLEPEEPAARRGVDQLGAGRLEVGQGRAYVVDLVGDVVHPRAALRDELADGRLGAERRAQLDAARAHAQRRGLDALVGHGVAVLQLRPEEALVCGDRLVEVGDRDAEMVNAARLHRDRCYRSSTASMSPYSTASCGVMKRSRSMSCMTCSTSRLAWWAMTSAICRVVAATSFAAIWMSAGVPR